MHHPPYFRDGAVMRVRVGDGADISPKRTVVHKGLSM